ncbi:hypothetical protein [Rubrivivax albus]|uniref:Uncharacterized protein n=1 Tax=Rubrivivax albus TaxID=2499835 RepID=A0A437JRL8_9BURK|nr:hypothetical protein [Rubrivivax albus]RVT49586.1 hypothetical protein ENE75_18175 [Rubrivivax albus]
MERSSRDRLSVDLRGLKAPLLARAQAQRLTPSAFIRGMLAAQLGPPQDAASHPTSTSPTRVRASRVRLSLRMGAAEARRIHEGARRSGVSVGDYLSGLAAGVPVFTDGGTRQAHVGALMASTAELATLSRHLHRLATLLASGNVEAARPYRAMLASLNADVRRHLALASTVLADLQPRRGTAQPADVWAR